MTSGVSLGFRRMVLLCRWGVLGSFQHHLHQSVSLTPAAPHPAMGALGEGLW